jgi:5-methylthioadenosine/S-adenosylhomocysteine deaminase
MKVAASEMRAQGIRVDPKQLVAMVTATSADIAGLGDKLGRVAEGRPADLVVLRRLADDAHESVLLSTPQDVELVSIGGDITYARTDWIEKVTPGISTDNLAPVLAWGKRMMLDNGFRAGSNNDPMPTLDQLRADLIQAFPQVGPIWG